MNLSLPTHIPSFSPTNDVLIIGAVAGFVVLAVMMGSARLKLLSLSMFAGYAAALIAIPIIYDLIGKPGNPFSLINLQYLTMGLIMGFLGFFGSNAYHRQTHSNFIINLVAGVMSGLALVVLCLNLLAPGALAATKGSSTLAMAIYETRAVWILGAPVALILSNFIHTRRH